MLLEQLSRNNVEKYIEYLKRAMAEEPDMMWTDRVDEYRHKGVARKLFEFFENDCRDNGINQYYLIRAKNNNAVRFYNSFAGAKSEEELVLRKDICAL